jgi:hypothetical protein
MLQQVQKKAVALDQCAERILAKAALDTNRTVNDTQTELHVVRKGVVDLKGATADLTATTTQTRDEVAGLAPITRETRDGVHRLGVAGDQFARKFDSRMHAQSSQLGQLDDNLQAFMMDTKRVLNGVDAQNGAVMMLADSMKSTSDHTSAFLTVPDLLINQERIERNQARISYELAQRPRTPDSGYAQIMSLPEFFSALGVPLSLFNNDLRTAVGRNEEFKGRVQRQAQSLLKTKEFGRWLGGRYSDLLLVDGNMDAAATESLSALSLLCATLIASITRVKPGSIVLHFFCGLHTASNDAAVGPGGMVRALLTQLAASLRTTYRLNLSFIRTDDDIADLEARNLDMLCSTLHHVLMQVPAGTPVFCIIDGVSAFERNYHNFRADLVHVVRSLKQMVANKRRAAPFKVLLTSSSRSTDIARKNIVEKWQHITLLDSGEGSGPAMITDRAVETALQPKRGLEQFEIGRATDLVPIAPVPRSWMDSDLEVDDTW